MRVTRIAVPLFCAVGLIASACSSSPTNTATAGGGVSPAATGAVGTTSVGATSGSSAAALSFPGAEWAETTPAVAGFEGNKLDALAEAAKSAESNCLLVTKNGQLVGEWYFKGTTPTTRQEVFSATKSYSSTLVGIAQGEGKLSINEPASKYIPQWATTASNPVTIRNLLSNDSGRFHDFATDYIKMAAASPDKTQFAIDLDQGREPGTEWVYNNSAIQTLDRVLQAATGQSPADYATEKLLAPIGMRHSAMTKDPAGNTLTFMGLQSTCRDMARFGHLFLSNGSWDGTQVVPADWVREATSPSQKLNEAYGYLWWLNAKGNGMSAQQATTGGSVSTEKTRQMVPGAPEDAFFALGLGEQVISVLPSEGIVAVRLGPGRVPEGTPKFGPGVLTLGVLGAQTP